MKILLIFVILLFSRCVKDNLHVVIIHSYDMNFIFSREEDVGVVHGIKGSGFFEGINLEVSRFFMQTKKNNTTPSKKLAVAKEILHDLEKIDYDAVATLDDDAFQYLAPNISKKKPVVFCGMNALPEYYNNHTFHFMDTRIHPGGNVTGVVEYMYFSHGLNLFSYFLPIRNTTIGVVIDDTNVGKYIHQQFDRDKKENEHVFINLEIKVETFIVSNLSHFKAVLEFINSEDKFSLLFPNVFSILDDKTGKIVGPEVLVPLITKQKKPEIALSNSYVQQGWFAGVSSDTYGMGTDTGRKVGQIFRNIFVGDISIEKPFFALSFNVDRGKELGIVIPKEVLKFATYIYHNPKYEYPVYIIVIIVCLGFCCAIFCVTSIFLFVICIFCSNIIKIRKQMKILKLETFGRNRKKWSGNLLDKLQIDEKLFQKLLIKKKDLQLIKEITREDSGNVNIFVYKWKKKIVCVKDFPVINEDSINLFASEFNVLLLNNLNPHKNLLKFYGAVVEQEKHEIVINSTEKTSLIESEKRISISNLSLVLEYIEGGNLSEFISKNRTISKEEKLFFVNAIAEGVQFLHSKGIIRKYLIFIMFLDRDLKPHNILVTENGDNIKIIDFGFSKEIMQAVTKKIGTSFWVAPEIIKGETYQILYTTNDPYGFFLHTDFSEIFKLENKVAQNSDYRPIVDETRYPEMTWYINLMKLCWDHNQEVRPSFIEILEVFRKNVVIEILEKIL